jgi:Ino eighty subunit 2
MTGKRSTRAQDNTRLQPYNEDEDPSAWDDDEDSEDEMDLRPGSPENLLSPEDLPSSSEEESEDDDEEMEPVPPPRAKQVPSRPVHRPATQKMTIPNSKPTANPAVIVTPASNAPLKSVEEKEMEMENDEDEELSELDSNAEEEDQDETMLDAEGDEDELGAEEDAEGDEDIDAEGEIDSDDETPGSGSGTPKQQTKRQRGQDEGAFLALPMEPQIKKILTADEHRMRRAEMARRRKNLSEKRNEEEKVYQPSFL